VVGALAFAVSVQGSPRAGERVKSDGKSGATRLVTGPSAQINDAIAAGGTATIAIQPVAPKTLPLTPTNGAIVGQTQTLATVPARVWAEVLITGWAPETLKTCQVTVDGNDADMDGGGYSGGNAGCGGTGGNIGPALQTCTTNADCRPTMSGIAAACGVGEPSKCMLADAYAYLPPGVRYCEPGFQDKCDAEWGASGVAHTAAADISTYNYRYGFTVEPGEVPTDFAPSYIGTLVLDVPASAKGSYFIDTKEDETFLQNPNNPPANVIPLFEIYEMTIVVACGSCCFGVGGAAPGCTDNLSAAECAALAPVSIFNAGGTCLNPPTDDGCCACLVDGDCNDGDACTRDICNSCVCSNPPVATWDQATECCNAQDGSQDLLGCADQCQAASCTLPGNRGDAQCTDRTGQGCDDDNPCSYADTCADGAGSCAGLDANAVACVDSLDCAEATGVGYPCIDGFCNCTLTPDLDIDIVDFGDRNCFEDGEKVLAHVHVAASSSPVNGGEFLLHYDPTCLIILVRSMKFRTPMRCMARWSMKAPERSLSRWVLSLAPGTARTAMPTWCPSASRRSANVIRARSVRCRRIRSTPT
jgi:hypothetical protein